MCLSCILIEEATFTLNIICIQVGYIVKTCAHTPHFVTLKIYCLGEWYPFLGRNW